MVEKTREPLGRMGASAYALGVHIALIGLLALSFRFSHFDTSYVVKSDQRVIQAFMVGPIPNPRPLPATPPAPRPTPQVIPEPVPLALQKAQAHARQLAHQKALEEAHAKVQALAKAEAMARAKARAQVAAKKAAEAHAHAQALARLKAEEQKAALRARAHLARQIAATAKRAQERAAARAAAQAASEAAARGVVDRYKALIEARVSAAWVAVPGTKGLRCDVAVHVIAGGQVVSVRVLESSGNVVFDRSVVAAIYNAAPLPVPKSPAKLQYLSRFHFIFMAPKGSSS